MARFKITLEGGKVDFINAPSEDAIKNLGHPSKLPIINIERTKDEMDMLLDGVPSDKDIPPSIPPRKSEPQHSQPIPQQPINPPPIQKETEFEFSEAGVDFKVKGDMVFKKTWVLSKDDDARIVTKTGKVYDGDQYKIEKIKWIKIK